ncbi:MAG: TMEM14 family protein [Isosphaeraceae bacterium]
MISLTVGQTILSVYALLLAVGGVIGYTKAGSRPSLIAGIASAIVVVIALFLTTTAPRLGLGIGAVVALLLAGFFGSRFSKTGKFMPSGMMAVVSVLTLIVAALGLF